MNHIEYLKSLGACYEAFKWAATHPNMDTAWEKCHRADWMLWLADKAGVERKTLLTIACEIARDVLPLFEVGRPNDTRPRVAIETAERFTRGEATIEECQAVQLAAAVASAAADAASAAADAASAAAYYAAYAAYYAAYAAYAAAYAAYAAYYAAYAADTRTVALARYAHIVRKHIPVAPVPAGILKGGE